MWCQQQYWECQYLQTDTVNVYIEGRTQHRTPRHTTILQNTNYKICCFLSFAIGCLNNLKLTIVHLQLNHQHITQLPIALVIYSIKCFKDRSIKIPSANPLLPEEIFHFFIMVNPFNTWVPVTGTSQTYLIYLHTGDWWLHENHFSLNNFFLIWLQLL